MIQRLFTVVKEVASTRKLRYSSVERCLALAVLGQHVAVALGFVALNLALVILALVLATCGLVNITGPRSHLHRVRKKMEPMMF